MFLNRYKNVSLTFSFKIHVSKILASSIWILILGDLGIGTQFGLRTMMDSGWQFSELRLTTASVMSGSGTI